MKNCSSHRIDVSKYLCISVDTYLRLSASCQSQLLQSQVTPYNYKFSSVSYTGSHHIQHFMAQTDHRVGYIVLAIIAAILYFTAIGYSGWDCKGSILSAECTKYKVNLTTGALLLTAGLVVFVASLFLIAVVVKGNVWLDIVSTVLTGAAAILAMAGVFYYLNSRNIWSPFVATIAMSITVALAAILIFDHCSFSTHKA